MRRLKFMARPGILPAEEAVLIRISNILMSDACQSIDFRYAGFHLDWVNYTAVALSAASPDPKPDRLRVIVGAFQDSTEASYDWRTNTLKLKAWSYGATVFSEKSTIVHECTHAAVDQQGSPKTISRVDNEILAYVAQALFVRLSGSIILPGSGPTALAAQDVANKIKDQPGSSLDANDAARLKQTLVTEPLYASLKTRSLTDTNNGIPF
jgi:hypothetical protein